MHSTIGVQLVKLDASGELKDIFSRGTNMEMFGVSCQYLGPSPDGNTNFWVGPGDIRGIDLQTLRSMGYDLRDMLGNHNGRKKSKN